MFKYRVVVAGYADAPWYYVEKRFLFFFWVNCGRRFDSHLGAEAAMKRLEDAEVVSVLTD